MLQPLTSIAWSSTDANMSTLRLHASPLCPDMIEWRDLGDADNLRGRVVRAFFWLMRWWPV
jgi:hypothetical protein